MKVHVLCITIVHGGISQLALVARVFNVDVKD